jgi:hypothetical protein
MGFEWNASAESLWSAHRIDLLNDEAQAAEGEREKRIEAG